ncbi:hypothetical protein AB0D66_32630 [Streptomyces sp. NPDC048270]|uniref:hypothetical protein n=1 Tax=Streptomyces sp. NPDC048270 TaxID=3154615 RepID=UPI0033F3239D
MLALPLRTHGRRFPRTTAAVVAISIALFVATVGTTPAAATGADEVTPASTAHVASSPGINLGSWMEQLSGTLGDRPLHRVVMPGSHDSGSWSITKDSGICPYGETADVAGRWPALAASVSRNQSGSIVRQLDAGARYLDLRLCKVDGAWYTYHGGPRGGLFFATRSAAGTAVHGEAEAIAAWIARHPREIVFIKLLTAAPPATAKDDHAEALRRLGDALGGGEGNPALADATLAPTSTYRQFMAAGKHVALIDPYGGSGYPWTWPQTAMAYRGSYTGVSNDWQDILKEVFLPGTRQRNYEAVKRRGSEVLGRAPGADANKLFILQGIIDPTHSIPDSAALQALALLRLLPSDTADNYLLHLAREMNKELLSALRKDWNHSDATENMNIVMTDDVNQDSNGVAHGEIQRELIAKNLAVRTTPHTYYLTGRTPDGNWSSPTAMGGAGNAFRFTGGQQALAPTSDGGVQVLGIGSDGNIWHNLRRGDGGWQGWNVLPAADNRKPGFQAVDVAMTAMPGGDAQIIAVARDRLAYHNVRHADGSWQGWASMPGSDGGLVRAHRAAAAGMPDGSTRVAVLHPDGAVRLSTRAADGSWRPWTGLPGLPPGNADPGLAVSAVGSEAQLVAIGGDGNLWHDIVHADGSRQGWRAPPGNGTPAMPARAAAITGTANGESQILMIGDDGNAHHTVRRADGAWDPFRPLPVGPQALPRFAASTIGIVSLADGSAQTVIGAR